MKPRLHELLDIKYPIILAPMFLVSNTKMIIAALDAGITAAIPALNFRTEKELIDAVTEIRKHTDKPFGINLIVNNSNPKYKSQLDLIVNLPINFIITSLGNPYETIQKSHQKGIKVFCDVTNLQFAKKVEELGADALIAVNSNAGGHLGNLTPEELIPLLKTNCKIPVISAGGISTGTGVKYTLDLGADGLSIGTAFIASNESDVSDDYKNAIVSYTGKDIIKSTRLSGTPCTVIGTPYVMKNGIKPSFLEKLMHRYKFLKKYIKMYIGWRGLVETRKSAFSATYQTYWVAGSSIENIHAIRPIKAIVEDLTSELN